MWFLIAILILVWLISFITFGSAAYWVHVLLVVALVLFVLTLVRSRRGAV